MSSLTFCAFDEGKSPGVMTPSLQVYEASHTAVIALMLAVAWTDQYLETRNLHESYTR